MAEAPLIKVPNSDEELMEIHEGFDANIYRQHFAGFHYNYVRGFRELHDLLQLEPNFQTPEMVTEFLKGTRLVIIPRIPPEWVKVLTRNAHWGICHPSQIERICAGEPTRLDRGCQAILALDVAFRLAQNPVLKTLNVFDYVKLVAANASLRNLSDKAKSWLKGHTSGSSEKRRYDDLVQELCPDDGRDVAEHTKLAKKFLANAACGYALTYESARIIVSYLNKEWGTPQILNLRNRVEGGRRKKAAKGEKTLRACDHEGLFIRLDRDKLKLLKALQPSRKTVQARS